MFVCLADWGSASDTLTDTLSFSSSNIAFGCSFLSFMRHPFLGARMAKVGVKVTPSKSMELPRAGRPAVPISALVFWKRSVFGMFFITFLLKYRAFCLAFFCCFVTTETISALVSSDTLSDTLCFLLWNLGFNRVFVMFCEENEAVSALICSDTLSDALSVSPYNIAFDCPFPLCHQDNVRLLSGLGISK